MTNAKEPTACYGGCGQKELEPQAKGWDQLPITGRWRCMACTRQLQEASREETKPA
jgi:hypothetical protein